MIYTHHQLRGKSDSVSVCVLFLLLRSEEQSFICGLGRAAVDYRGISVIVQPSFI